MKIAFFDTGFAELTKKELGDLQKQLKGHDVSFHPSPLHKSDLSKLKNLQVVCVFVSSKISKEIIQKLPNIKLLVAMSVGVDHIDIEYCTQNNITICNVPAYGPHTVAEHTLGLMLALSHNLYEGINRTKKLKFTFKGLEGFDLKGKTLGVLGAGRIGSEVIKRAHAFGMHILAYNEGPSKNFIKLPDLNYTNLNNLLKHSNVITIHLPLTKQTKHLLGHRQFQIMRRGTYLINTARGGIIDTNALIYALKSGKLAGVALDVLEHEPPKALELKLLRMPNVIVTPHSAFYTKEAVENILKTAVTNIKSFINGKPVNCVV